MHALQTRLPGSNLLRLMPIDVAEGFGPPPLLRLAQPITVSIAAAVAQLGHHPK
jgi:hypothetical protein